MMLFVGGPVNLLNELKETYFRKCSFNFFSNLLKLKINTIIFNFLLSIVLLYSSIVGRSNVLSNLCIFPPGAIKTKNNKKCNFTIIPHSLLRFKYKFEMSDYFSCYIFINMLCYSQSTIVFTFLKCTEFWMGICKLMYM